MGKRKILVTEPAVTKMLSSDDEMHEILLGTVANKPDIEVCSTQPVTTETELIVASPNPLPNIDCDEQDVYDLEEDYITIRKGIKESITNLTSVIQESLELARETDHPLAYQAVASLVDKVAALNKNLMTIHQMRGKIKRDARGSAPKNAGLVTSTSDQPAPVTNNIVFAGSTKQLLELIQSKKLDES